jgi:hypothetical protein
VKSESGLSAALDTVPTDAHSLAFIGDTERRNGWEAAVEQIIGDSQAIARAARAGWMHPRYDEIVKRRAVDHQPCRARCRSCSRCVHSLAYYARGGRSLAAGEVVPPW